MSVFDANPILRVRASRDVYRRGGFVFGRQDVEVSLADFNDEKDAKLRIDAIMNDPALHIDIFEAGEKLPKAEVAKIRQQFADKKPSDKPVKAAKTPAKSPPQTTRGKPSAKAD